jgi:hypothetical protein
VELPRVSAARPSPLIVGTISTVARLRRSTVRRSQPNASSLAMIRHASRDDGSLPWTLQLTSTACSFAIAFAERGGFGYPITNMLIGRSWSVRPISTTRTREPAASSAAVYSYSFTSLVYCAAWVSSHWVRRLSPGRARSPHCGFVVPSTGAEYGCGVVPARARTRHWNLSPGLNPASANVGESGVTVRLGRHTPTTAGGPVGVSPASTGVRSIW